MDECMQCVCKYGKAACATEDSCLKGLGDVSSIGGDLSEFKGFKNKATGELIEPFGQRHAEAIDAVMAYVSKKKAILHEKHGPSPTREQFLEVFADNYHDIVLMQGDPL